MSWDPKSRRHFLRGIGQVTLALPFLPSLAPRRAFSAPASVPRFICVWQDNGRDELEWYPLEGGKVLTPPQVLSDGTTREMSLRSLPGPISKMIGPEFDRHRDKLLLLRHLNCFRPIGTHTHTLSLSGTGTKEKVPTIDQVLAASPKVYPFAPKKKVLNLVALRKGQPQGDAANPKTISFDIVNGSPVRVLPATQPKLVFEQLFGAAAAAAPAAGTQDQAVLRHKGDLTVVDRVFGEFSQLKKDCRLSADDRGSLDAHLTFLHELHQRLQQHSPSAAPASACNTSSFANRDWEGNRTTSSAVISDNIDVVVAAIMCGYTKVATLMLMPPSAFDKFSFNHKRDFHTNSHSAFIGADHYMGRSPEPLREFNEINRFFGKKVAELVAKLDRVEDPTTGRTYLDNSMVLWTNALGHPNHQNLDLPVLLAGSGGGRLRTGRYIDFRQRVYNDLLVTLLQTMGLEPADYERGGVPGYGDYSSPSQAASSRRTGLPYLRA
jgi:hypothetical protein